MLVNGITKLCVIEYIAVINSRLIVYYLALLPFNIKNYIKCT
ncbi:hypothetical protein A1OE_1281 [Candidatus Endolissoclinum faulkneri L2]|uniref:Uncharacterized protein n=1 Tax=Candidatus Endolissoclinum faulkneri L2 TaxID=1193729 RepID=K7YSG6_9PROT|nr:hypothetical protein A1OE_1281 [Candidatus Endolissoclinum faulkneri L2]